MPVTADTATCPDCGDEFPTEDELREHYFEAHLHTLAASSADTRDDDTSAPHTSMAARGAVLPGAVGLAGVLVGLGAVAASPPVSLVAVDSTRMTTVVYGLGALVCILLVITLLIEVPAMRSDP